MGWVARCPAHDDRRASLSISEGDDGRVLVKCHAGCTTEAVVEAVGLVQRDLFLTSNGPPSIRCGKSKPNGKPAGTAYPTADAAVADLERRQGKRSALWTYHNAHREPVGLVIRWDLADGKKDIRPVTKYPDGWRVGAMPEPRPLYGLPELGGSKLVVVCEGEKCADAARSLGFTATTSAGGGSAPGKTDWSPLAGKDVWVLPDNDQPGRKYADTVAGILTALDPPARVKVVELPALPEKGDLVDWIVAHGDAAEPDGMRAEIETLADAADPPQPDPPDDLTYRPFPVEALPEPIRGFVTAGARAMECDPSYLALPLLTALAAAIGNTRRLELKRGWSAPAILWGAIVGESGTTKTPAFKLVTKPVWERHRKALDRHAEAEQKHEADLARWEKEKAAWNRSKGTAGDPPTKPEPPHAERFIVADTTVEALAPILLANPRGLLLARDELSGWIGSFDRYAGKGKTSADSASWLSMFNAESIVVDRKTGVPRTIHVPQAAVCVAGGIQPGILERALGAEHRESGLAARLLLAYPPRKVKHWTEADIDPAAEAELARLFDRLHELEPSERDDGNCQSVLVRLDAAAKAAWVAYYNAHAHEQVGLTGDLSAAWSKLEEYAARLALVVHFARWAAHDPGLACPNTVDVGSMNAGIALVTWFKHEARRVYAILGESGADRDERRLVEWIERRGGSATAREVQQGCRWLNQSGSAEAALEELVRTKRGIWEPTQPGRRGQPTRRFRLVYGVYVYGNHNSQRENTNTVDVDTVDAAGTHPDGGRR